MINRFSIKTKSLLMLGALFLALVVVAAVVLNGMRVIAKQDRYNVSLYQRSIDLAKYSDGVAEIHNGVLLIVFGDMSRGRVLVDRGKKDSEAALRSLKGINSSLLHELPATHARLESLVDEITTHVEQHRAEGVTQNSIKNDIYHRQINMILESVHSVRDSLDLKEIILGQGIQEAIQKSEAVRNHAIMVSLWTVVGSFVFALFWIIAISAIFIKNILHRLHLISESAKEISQGKFNVVPLGHEQDELTVVTHVFNDMVNRVSETQQDLENKVRERTAALEESQKSARESAHAAGMAEISSNTLHNVGNTLNSMNISVDVLDHIITQSKTPVLQKSIQLLKVHEADLPTFLSNDDKGKMVVPFISMVTDTLQEEQKKIKEELITVKKQVELMTSVIHAQQKYAKKEAYLEETSLANTVEEILKMQNSTILRHHIQVVKNFTDVPPVKLNPVKFAHILLNLFRNAKEAMISLPVEQKVLTFEIGQMPNEEVYLKVSDKGEGITKENLVHMFRSGFTTKKEGHGFGLHFCSLAMKEMEGRLIAESDGPGKGASFILVFSPAKKVIQG